MLPLIRILALLLFGSLTLAACSSTEESTSTPLTVTLTVTSQPASTEVKVLPSPSSGGDSIVWDDLQVTADQFEVTQDYLTDFGSTRTPPAGSKFLWIHIRLRNRGQIEMDVPLSEHFSVLYAATELKPTYGHRLDYPDYTALSPVIFPAQELEGWLRFDIPTTAELSDLRIIFLPESSQVGTSYNSPNYPYADDKPTYVWNVE